MPILLILMIAPVAIAIITAIFQCLWNMTIPEIFGLNKIRFWQAFRLLLLAGILFGGRWVSCN